ncbi:MAG: site-specific integrase [Chloroflexota bacterium]|nr:site-specific integrase [Chloroflexota bacterium]
MTEELPLPDSLAAWIALYQRRAVVGVRTPLVAAKIALHLGRFQGYFAQTYGHDQLAACVRRDVLGWQAALCAVPLAPATVNNHLASLSGFATWVTTQAPTLFAAGHPWRGIGELGLGPFEPRALTPEQVRSLQSLCDRLSRFHQLHGQPGTDSPPPTHHYSRPWRDRALVLVLLSTGLRREELTRLDLALVVPATAAALRRAHQGRLTRVRGKGHTERVVFLSADARTALADYLERERPGDAAPTSTALFLSAAGLPSRRTDGRLALGTINKLLARIGRWHDSEQRDPARSISPLRPHDLRHTFAFQLARTTGADSYELERRLGHRSQRYIARYTNPPEAVAASYVEDF